MCPWSFGVLGISRDDFMYVVGILIRHFSRCTKNQTMSLSTSGARPAHAVGTDLADPSPYWVQGGHFPAATADKGMDKKHLSGHSEKLQTLISPNLLKKNTKRTLITSMTPNSQVSLLAPTQNLYFWLRMHLLHLNYTRGPCVSTGLTLLQKIQDGRSRAHRVGGRAPPLPTPDTHFQRP